MSTCSWRSIAGWSPGEVGFRPPRPTRRGPTRPTCRSLLTSRLLPKQRMDSPVRDVLAAETATVSPRSRRHAACSLAGARDLPAENRRDGDEQDFRKVEGGSAGRGGGLKAVPPKPRYSIGLIPA